MCQLHDTLKTKSEKLDSRILRMIKVVAIASVCQAFYHPITNHKLLYVSTISYVNLNFCMSLWKVYRTTIIMIYLLLISSTQLLT